MADFTTPFANNGGRRLPTADERVNGFPCGPADQTLFNGMFHRIESELGNLIAGAGLVPSDGAFDQVLKAVKALLAAQTGEGDTESFLLLDQARQRLPIFPEVNTSDGRIEITAPVNGSVRLPGGLSLVHRGIFVVNTAQTDFPTNASRTYHLRWNRVDGFVLRDTLNLGYNPNGLAEDHETFDSGYDDALIARIVTSSSNVATITNLANKSVLRANGEANGPKGSLGQYDFENDKLPSEIQQYVTIPINWARRPDAYLSAVNDVHTQAAQVVEFNVGIRTLNRYSLALWAQGDFDIRPGWVARA